MTLAEMRARRLAIKQEMRDAKTMDELNTKEIELRNLDSDIKDAEVTEAAEARAAAEAAEAEKRKKDPDGRTAVVTGQTPGVVVANARGQEKPEDAEARKADNETAEKRGADMLAMKSVNVSVRSLGIIPERRSVTVGSSNIIVPKYTDPTLSPTFNEVSSLVDRVQTKMLIGGESYTKGYITGYGTAGYSTEANNYTSAEPTFAYAEINKTKITAYAEDTTEILKLPTIDYDSEVMNGIRVATRKFISREILVGTGATNHLAGIFSAAATAISSSTDLSLAAIDEDTLDSIVFGFGGDENVEDAAVLILNKSDLKAFSLLRDANGKKLHEIKISGNTGTIDTIPFIINSACYSVGSATSGQYCMAYGPLSNYMLTIFSDMDVQRSTDFLFKTGQLAHRGDIFAGGNVVSKNGFLRVKKSA